MDSLPYEIKRFIYDVADLETIKALRLVSSSWASVGIELLFLPTFVIKSYASDLQRLINIGSVQQVSLQAAKTIRALEFTDNQFDPSTLRRIFCSRHVRFRREYPLVHFVPTELEQASMDELDAVIVQRRSDDEFWSERGEDFLVEAFRTVPLVNKICFSIQNPFQQPLLKKVWEEYEYETYDAPDPHESRSVNLFSIITAIHRSGLSIQNFQHERFLLHRHATEQGGKSLRMLTGVKALKLSILDVLGRFNNDVTMAHLDQRPGIKDLLCANSNIEDLSLYFQGLSPPRMNLARSVQSGCLRVVALHSLEFRGSDLLAFLVANAATLKWIKLQGLELTHPDDTWQALLTSIRNTPGFNIEKFQVGGVTKSVTKTWILWSIYDAAWNPIPNDKVFLERYNSDGTNKITKMIEGFVMGNEEWPTEVMLSLDVPAMRT